MSKNLKQDDVINSIDGIYVVDAGAGTGKTYSITKRYLKILEKTNTDLKDILLLTFTNNAAYEMKEKIVNELIRKDPETNIIEANISTFHSFCQKFLNLNGKNTPSYLGIEDQLNQNYYLSENEVFEKMFFKKTYNSFKKNHPEYSEEYKIVKDIFDILSLIRKLLSKGIFPKRDGWFMGAEKIFDGNYKDFMEKAEQANFSDKNQSELLKKFKTKKNSKTFYDLPENFEESKKINPDLLEESFNENRENWKSFVHDVYFNYIEFSVKENRLNFEFLIMFGFLELYHNKEVREKNSFEYVMIDEFQDTNSIQFMIVLMLMKKNNLCVVGDWKQGIYSFRNATIDNITEFGNKIKEHKESLNSGERRVNLDLEPEYKEFEINFRSSQNILDFSLNALDIEATSKEIIETNREVVKLKASDANKDLHKKSEIEFFELKDKDEEIKFAIAKIQELIKKPLIIKQDGKERPAELKDFAILSRTRNFGLEIQKLGMQYNIPINYEGQIELFNTEESVLLLAVLRILVDRNDDRGWATILDYYKYSLGEKKTDYR